jgi:hypothetical protein
MAAALLMLQRKPKWGQIYVYNDAYSHIHLTQWFLIDMQALIQTSQRSQDQYQCLCKSNALQAQRKNRAASYAYILFTCLNHCWTQLPGHENQPCKLIVSWPVF